MPIQFGVGMILETFGNCLFFHLNILGKYSDHAGRGDSAECKQWYTLTFRGNDKAKTVEKPWYYFISDFSHILTLYFYGNYLR